jgi:two-component system, OmpR family, osmolarity sensor histidine kinase EnvZ
MKLWPRSLFWRSALLIGSLLLVSQVVLSIVFYVFVQRPRLDFAQDLTLIYLDNVRTALIALPPTAREKFLNDVDSSADLRITREFPKPEATAISKQPLVRVFMRELQERLPKGERVITQEMPFPALWVSLLVEGESYWIVVRLSKIRIDSNTAWVALFVISLSLAVVGGVLIHRSLNQPLAKLQSFAVAIGRGERPKAVDVDGPQEVANLSRAFNRMVQDLDSMDADRRLMLAGISHDLRTPVTRLLLALEVNGEQLDAQIFDRMLANLRELDSSLTQFLDFARSESEESVSQANLCDIANECTANFESHGHAIALRGEQVRAHANARVRPQAIMRALTNLVENSLKYSRGEIEIEVVAANGVDGPALIVRDRGTLLQSADFERLRKPFVRMNEARGGPAGTGLGLAIVERIANLHNAILRFNTRDGGGLEVCIVFPQSE